MSKRVPNKKYTPEFKKLVVETMLKEKLSYSETAERFEMLQAVLDSFKVDVETLMEEIKNLKEEINDYCAQIDEYIKELDEEV